MWSLMTKVWTPLGYSVLSSVRTSAVSSAEKPNNLYKRMTQHCRESLGGPQSLLYLKPQDVLLTIKEVQILAKEKR